MAEGIRLLENGIDEIYTTFYECSECGYDSIFKDAKYCPGCGKKIDGVMLPDEQKFLRKRRKKDAQEKLLKERFAMQEK